MTAGERPLVSATAAKLLRLLSQRPGEYTIEEVAADLRVSKTAVRQALSDLEEAGAVQVEED